jgi:dTDP-4-amino-4,6-dideoxygalactose transaminase
LLIGAVDDLRREGATVAAVMSVDLFGRCADYGALVAALEARGIPLVEDAAEALGASQGGRPAGSFGRAAALSFNGNKIMTTSGGGMLLSDDLDLLRRARYLSTQARQPAPWYQHTEVGYNYRLSNLLAALGRAQLSRLDAMIERRRAIRTAYIARLGDIPGVRFLGAGAGTVPTEDNCWLTCVVLDPNVTVTSPESLIKSLDAADIEARYLWKPMHLQPVYASARTFMTGVSDLLFTNGVALPSGSVLSEDDVDRVIATTASILGAA